MSLRIGPGARGLVAAIAILLTLAGCRVRTEVNIAVREDGSGTVEAAVALDDDAVSRRPDLAEELALDDLVASGWEITGPSAEDDGDTWIRAVHEFSTPAEVGPLVEEIAGVNGPFREFELRRTDGFADTTYRFAGMVDFTSGLDRITADEELADLLEDDPARLLSERLGSVIDEFVQVRVAVRLPGDVSSNAPAQASNGAVWSPSVVEREAIVLSAAGVLSRPERWLFAGLAAAGALAFVFLLVVRVALWSRQRTAA